MIGRVLLIVSSVGLGQAHEPITTKITWTLEISRIVYKRCLSCHREGGTAPMSLVSYEEARPWAKAIKEEVLERRMPPWGAVKGFGDFADDVSLSEREIAMFVNWVEGGAPKGEELYAPPAPVLDAPPETPPAPGGEELRLRGTLTLKRGWTAVGIRPQQLQAGASLQVIAQRPDGSVEHLIWILNYRPEWQRTYVYRSPVKLPKGTRIQIVPAGAGTTSLVSVPGS